MNVLQEAGAQIVALAAFFAFPALQYLWLKHVTRTEAEPELWYLPAYGFRLVIRNLPGKRTLSEIKYRVLSRKIVDAGTGASVKTFVDTWLVEKEDFFVFPRTDQLLISFKLIRTEAQEPVFVLTDKLGVEQRRMSLAECDLIIADYTANVENYFNFDIKLSKRVEIKKEALASALLAIETNTTERLFPVSRVRNVG